MSPVEQKVRTNEKFPRPVQFCPCDMDILQPVLYPTMCTSKAATRKKNFSRHQCRPSDSSSEKQVECYPLAKYSLLGLVAN